MSRYIKYFADDGKNCLLKLKMKVYFLNIIKYGTKLKTLNIRFHIQLIYDEKYIKNKVQTFNGVINTHFSDNKIAKEGNHYICIAEMCSSNMLKFIQNNVNIK